MPKTLTEIFPLTQENNYVSYDLKVINGVNGNKIDGVDYNDNLIRYSQAVTPHIVDVVPN